MELLRGIIEKKVITKTKRDLKAFRQMFPFNTHVSKIKVDETFKENWTGEFASFARLISGYDAEHSTGTQTNDFEALLQKMSIDPKDQDEFIALLNELINMGETKQQLQHPNMLLHLERADIKNRVFKISEYLYDLCKENTQIQALFDVNEKKDVLQTIMEDFTPALQDRKKVGSSFDHKLPWIGQLFADDLLFLKNHPDFFIKYADIVTYYYTFFLLSQNTVKLSLLDQADYSEGSVEPLYFTLDWETSVSSRREAVRKGFKYLEELSNKLFSTQLTLAQLSCNTENPETEWLLDSSPSKRNPTMMDFPTIKSLFDQLSSEEQNIWLNAVDEQSASIIEKAKMEYKVTKSETFSASVKQLIFVMAISSPEAAQGRYGSAITEIAKVRLVKQRGRNGNVLSLNQEMLTMFLVVIVRSSKMRLQDVYKELESRGVFLDRYSRIEFENTLEKMNLLIKMSDSGEAQYVKSIL